MGSSEQSDGEKPLSTCHGCGRRFARLYVHLTKNEVCRKLYDMDKLNQKIDLEKKEKGAIRIRRYREKQMKNKPDGFREDEAAGRQCRRQQEMEDDAEAYAKKREAERRNERMAKMEKDPDGFREDEATGRQSRRQQEMEDDAEALKRKWNTEKRNR